MTETAKGDAKTLAFYAKGEDREHIAMVAKMLRERGHRFVDPGVTAAVSYALRFVVLTECSENGSPATERNAAA